MFDVQLIQEGAMGNLCPTFLDATTFSCMILQQLEVRGTMTLSKRFYSNSQRAWWWPFTSKFSSEHHINKASGLWTRVRGLRSRSEDGRARDTSHATPGRLQAAPQTHSEACGSCQTDTTILRYTRKVSTVCLFAMFSQLTSASNRATLVTLWRTIAKTSLRMKKNCLIRSCLGWWVEMPAVDDGPRVDGPHPIFSMYDN